MVGQRTVGAEAPSGMRTVSPEARRILFESLEHEIGESVQLEVEGRLPRELDGTLYRVGPARHDVYGERYRHSWDGDGMVHAVQLSEGRAHYRSRFVLTHKKRAEDAAGRRLYSGFGTPPAGAPWARLRRHWPMSSANTNVVAYGGRLLALWEGGGPPWRLDPVTLDTLGEDDLGGVLGPGDALSAHPHWDPESRELWNFGVHYGMRTVLSLFRTLSDGATERVVRFPLPFPAFVHDFALTATKAVVVVVPMALPRVPLGLLTGWRSYGESLRWRPQQGTHVAVVDRASGAVRWYRSAPFFMAHTVNAWDEGDDVIVDVCAYQDASILGYLAEVMNREQGRPSYGFPERLRLTRAGALVRTHLSTTALELPRVATRVLCGEHRRIYGVAWTEDRFYVGVPAVIDLASGTSSVAPMRPGEFSGECVPVAKPGASSESDVWLLVLVLDALERRSELRVLDGADPSAPPVAVARLPHPVPAGFHGNWVPAALVENLR